MYTPRSKSSRNPFVCQVVSDPLMPKREHGKEGKSRNPFVCQVVSDARRRRMGCKGQRRQSQSLRMSGRFRSPYSFVSSLPRLKKSQSLRMSGRFRFMALINTIVGRSSRNPFVCQVVSDSPGRSVGFGVNAVVAIPSYVRSFPMLKKTCN